MKKISFTKLILAKYKISLLLVIFLISACFAVFPKTTYAVDFFIDMKVEYEIDSLANTTVKNSVTIENATSHNQASEYRLRLSSIEPENLKVSENGRELLHEVVREDDVYLVKVIFEEPIAGIGKKRSFLIEFKEKNFTVKTNEVWEISIPRLDKNNNFRTYDTFIIVPNEFGNTAYMSPEPKDVEERETVKIFHFDKELVQRSGIVAGFGNFQIFNFILNYHLENPLKKETPVELALPPDTSTQKVYYTAIDPVPDSVYVDDDGNWMAVYNLKPRQRLDVAAKGSVQLFAEAKKVYSQHPASFLKNTSPTNYWPSTDPEIIELAQKYNTPEEIYNFVTNYLSYNYDRVKPNAERLGAKRALLHKNNALCMEFTDLFIAIARAAGIPAREINGFAYTENPNIQPLSLVADVLHSWPEYWNNDKNTWIPIDPTWGSTTGGVDYFNKLDLRHFAFVIHGLNDAAPIPPGSYKLGANPQKDVFVTFGQMPTDIAAMIDITQSRQPHMFPYKDKYKITLVNRSASAYYNLNPVVEFDGNQQQSFIIDVFPPFAKYETEVEVTYGILSTKSPINITVKANGFSTTFETQKSRVIVTQLTIMSVTFLVLIMLLLIKTGKVKFTFMNKLLKRKNSVPEPVITNSPPAKYTGFVKRMLKFVKITKHEQPDRLQEIIKEP